MPTSRLVLAILLLATSAPGGELPFLPRDGAIWPSLPAPYRWLPVPQDASLVDPDPYDRPLRLRPDVTGERDEAIDAAIRAAFERRVRIELAVTFGGETTELSAVVPEGARFREDARVERAWPTGAGLAVKCGGAEHRIFRTGLAVEAAAARRGDGTWSLRLALRASRVLGERRFEGDMPTVVAPELELASLVADLAAHPGERATFRADGPEGVGSLTVTYGIGSVDDPVPPRGTRAYSLHTLRPIASRPPPPKPGRWFAAAETGEPDFSEPDIPEVWEAAAADVAKLVLAHPDVVIARGDAAALDALDRVVEAWWRARGAPVTLVRTDGAGPRTEISLAGGGRATLVQGTLRPVALDVEVEICMNIATAGLTPRWLLAGRTLTADADADGIVRVEETTGRVTSFSTGVRTIPSEDAEGPRRLRLPLDRFAVDVRQAGGAYRAGAEVVERDGDRTTTTEVRPEGGPR